MNKENLNSSKPKRHIDVPFWSSLPYFKGFHHLELSSGKPPFRYGVFQSFLTAFLSILVSSFLPFGLPSFLGVAYFWLGFFLVLVSLLLMFRVFSVWRLFGNDLDPLSFLNHFEKIGPFKRVNHPAFLSSLGVLWGFSLMLGGSVVTLFLPLVYGFYAYIFLLSAQTRMMNEKLESNKESHDET